MIHQVRFPTSGTRGSISPVLGARSGAPGRKVEGPGEQSGGAPDAETPVGHDPESDRAPLAVFPYLLQPLRG